MYKTAFNPGDSPVVVDGEGRTIGGGEWGTVQTTEDSASAALDSGALVIVEVDDAESGDLNPEAREVLKSSVASNGRHTELQGLDVEDLRKAAAKAGLIKPQDKSTKTELLAMLVRRPDVQVGPAKKPAAKSGEKES